MKSLKTYLLEGLTHDIENLAHDVMKKYKNKTVKLDVFTKDMLDSYGLEFDNDGSTEDTLSFWINLSNNAEGDDNNLILSVKRSGNNVKILDYSIE